MASLEVVDEKNNPLVRPVVFMWTMSRRIHHYCMFSADRHRWMLSSKRWQNWIVPSGVIVMFRIHTRLWREETEKSFRISFVFDKNVLSLSLSRSIINRHAMRIPLMMSPKTIHSIRTSKSHHQQRDFEGRNRRRFEAQMSSCYVTRSSANDRAIEIQREDEFWVEVSVVVWTGAQVRPYRVFWWYHGAYHASIDRCNSLSLVCDIIVGTEREKERIDNFIIHIALEETQRISLRKGKKWKRSSLFTDISLEIGSSMHDRRIACAKVWRCPRRDRRQMRESLKRNARTLR